MNILSFTNNFSPFSFYFFAIQLCLFDTYINICLILVANSMLVKLLCSKRPYKFKDTIIFYYNRQNTIRISGKVPLLFTWHIYQIIVDFQVSLLVNACVLN